MQDNRAKIGIVGLGWVGKSVKQLFPEAVVYDPAQGFTDRAALTAEAIFVCVPTPLVDGKLDCSIVQEAINQCSLHSLVILRSTVMPGFTDSQPRERRIVMVPEYLGETTQHPMLDVKARPFLILGGHDEDRRKAIEVYQKAYNANVTIRQMTAYQAEIVKLSENRAIAFKVGQCQELYDACEAAGTDYYAIRDAVYGDDPRMNLWWTFVLPDARGFNSKCIPKDVYGWAAWAESVGADATLTRALLETNDKLLHGTK